MYTPNEHHYLINDLFQKLSNAINNHLFVTGGVLGSIYSWLNGVEVLQLNHVVIDFNQLAQLAINSITGAVITIGVKFAFNLLQGVGSKIGSGIKNKSIQLYKYFSKKGN
ncbi:MAG: hypothetical protein V4538_01730 [Bacteroidota bacterium]